MAFSVTRKLGGFVTPANPLPTETLPLSSIDRVKGLRHMVRSMHVFKNGYRAAETIKEAMSKALVTYYPFAGRFIDDSEDGEVNLECRGEGVWFVEAFADCSLEDVRLLDYPLMISEDELFPVVSEEMKAKIHIPFHIQVTEFTCGGFALALISVHAMGDGLGVAQFFNHVGEIARGLPKPTIKPIWARHLIPNPPKIIPSGPPPNFPNLNLQNSTIDLSSQTIMQLKSEFLHSNGKHCSTFDISTAHLWQARTRSIGFRPDEPVQVCFFASIRHLLTDILPAEGGYYGNCFYPVRVNATAGKLADSNLLEVVRIVRDAKNNLPKEFAKWVVGELKEDPFELSFTYNSVFVSDWTRLGFREVDYGWGKPVNVVPFGFTDFMAVGIIGTLPVPKQGARIMTQCVKKEHLEEFMNEMKRFN